MNIFGMYIFPSILILSAFYLILKEWAIYRQSNKQDAEGRRAKGRFIRRSVGAVLVFLIAIMIYIGLAYFPHPTNETIYQQLNYWLVVMSIVFLSIVIAIWDMLASVKNLECIVGECSEESIEDLKKAIKETYSVDK
jgi:magnesium-transporting ATPase (P-type)